MDLSTLTLTHLRYLVAIDHQRSFRAAAEECCISQPTLSMQLQKLEEIVGARLFDRTRPPIVPTEIGVRVVRQARVILRETARVSEIANVGLVAGRYRLGVIPTLASSLVPLLLPGFAASYPEVELVIEEVETDRMIARLYDETLDGGLAATPLDAPMVSERVLYREPLSAYLPPKHSLARRARIRQSELMDERVWLMPEGHCFRTQVLHLCRLAARAPTDGVGAHVRFESGSFDTLIRVVDAGLGMTILPELVVRRLPAAVRRARVRPFEIPVPVREVSLVHVREHLRREIAERLYETLAKALPADLTTTRARTQERLDPLAKRVRNRSRRQSQAPR